MRALWLFALLTACEGRATTRVLPSLHLSSRVLTLPSAPPPLPLPVETSTPECGPSPDGKHCVLFELRRDDAASLARLGKLLAKDGLSLDLGPPGVVVTDAQLARIFHARVEYRLLAGNVSGWSCQAELANVNIPPRYAAYLRSLFVGHQICE